MSPRRKSDAGGNSMAAWLLHQAENGAFISEGAA